MPHYFFNLKTGYGVIRDLEGMELPDEGSARGHACDVARELMRNCESHTSLWRLSVCEGDDKSYFELLFASASPSLSHLRPETRASVEDVCQKAASLNDAINQVRITALQLRGTIARAEKAPYLAALDGVRL